jgi:hypothetical protein
LLLLIFALRLKAEYPSGLSASKTDRSIHAQGTIQEIRLAQQERAGVLSAERELLAQAPLFHAFVRARGSSAGAGFLVPL